MHACTGGGIGMVPGCEPSRCEFPPFLAPLPLLQVIARCQHCEAWHKLADAANLVEEIRYADLEDD